MNDRSDYSWLNDYWRHFGHQPERDRFRTSPELQPGTTIARYRVIRTLGSGGVGRVYLAEHELLPKKVAVKVHEDFPTHGGIASAFRQSASYLCQLNHPNIAFFIDYGIKRNRAYMVMEYVRGPSLSSLLGAFQTSQGTNRALNYFARILEATRYAHNCTFIGDNGEQSRGIIHGDITPENVLITETDVPKLTDFMVPDVQKLLAARQDRMFGGKPMGLTDCFGTPYYMAPEQVHEGRVSEQTDVFSLGVLLHHMLTGQYPYRSQDYAIRDRTARPSALNPHIPEWIDSVVATATELETDRRYRSVAELQREFLRHYERSSSKGPILRIKEFFMGDQTKVNVGKLSNEGGNLFIGKFNNAMASLQGSGGSTLVEALTDLKNAVMQSEIISDEVKKEAVEVVTQVAEESSKGQPNRTLLRALKDGLMATLKTVPDVSKALVAAKEAIEALWK